MLYRPGEHEPLRGGAWDETQARSHIATIVADAEAALDEDGLWPVHERDIEDGELPGRTTIYLGVAGMALALHFLGSDLDFDALLVQALRRYRAEPDYGKYAHAPSFWAGETGLLVVAETVGSTAADRERLRELVRANRSHESWEQMWGSPGTMFAARAVGLDAEWHESAEALWAHWTEPLWTQKLYGHVQTYIGPGHGFAGNVHALRGFVDDEVLRRRVEAALVPLMLSDGTCANWPPTTDSKPEQIRVQWCHGAPGIVTTIGDLMPSELAIAGGELTWRAGPLAKGAGLCHGTAGNGYAFLRLYALTGDPIWLERAQQFAMHALVQVSDAPGRYSLFTGDIGAAVFAQACIDDDPRFPTVDRW